MYESPNFLVLPMEEYFTGRRERYQRSHPGYKPVAPPGTYFFFWEEYFTGRRERYQRSHPGYSPVAARFFFWDLAIFDTKIHCIAMELALHI